MTEKTTTAAIYARVSTDDQKCDLQLTELRAFAERMGWKIVEYTERASGKAGSKRVAFEHLMTDARMRAFDIVLVWKMDRFGRSLLDLVTNVQTLDNLGIRFIAPNQSIDTDQKSPMGRLVLHLMAAFAEFERALIVERVRAGQQEYLKAYEAGRVGKDVHSKSGRDLAPGRPKRIFRRDKVEQLRAEGVSWRRIAKELCLPLSTIRPRSQAKNTRS